MWGARKPRLSDPTNVQRSSGVITAEARNVRAPADRLSSGHSGAPPTIGLSDASAR